MGIAYPIYTLILPLTLMHFTQTQTQIHTHTRTQIHLGIPFWRSFCCLFGVFLCFVPKICLIKNNKQSQQQTPAHCNILKPPRKSPLEAEEAEE